jgi:hypothetical protein
MKTIVPCAETGAAAVDRGATGRCRESGAAASGANAAAVAGRDARIGKQ